MSTAEITSPVSRELSQSVTSPTAFQAKPYRLNTRYTYKEAAEMIAKFWLSYRNRQMFQLLKTAVYAAENSLTSDVLRKIAPREANFFKDDSATHLKVKFRFGGTNFPPNVYFKIFMDTANCRPCYVNGRALTNASTMAAYDTLKLMGQRKYYTLMIQDMLHHEQHRITDPADVVTVRDYMHYLSVVDETPACLGGKENSWRKFSLENFPHHTILYDIVDFMSTRRLSSRLQARILPLLAAKEPGNLELLRAQIRLITEPSPPPPCSAASLQSLLSVRSSGPAAMGQRSTSRRSNQARRRVDKMRRVYQATTAAAASRGMSTTPTCHTTPSQLGERADPASAPHRSLEAEEGTSEQDDDEEEEDWEVEADKLCEWSQNLRLDEDLTRTY